MKRKQRSAHLPRPRNNQVRTTSHRKHDHLRRLQGRGPTSRTTPNPRHTARPTTPTETRHSRAITTVQARAMRNTWKRREENVVTTTATKPPPLASKRGTRSPHALLTSLASASVPAQGRDRATTETHNTRNTAAWPSCGLTPDTTTWLRNQRRERQ
ncbi:hypothetical protein Taro_055383 [Colocasia esculenta]|uniref:Uncharacterized protein n=1 Tax=Colocasia esculenta TaxID=4460 RepID=A0A843XT50_COLES|nr:hypothetical protein [Colocasia esculenta]